MADPNPWHPMSNPVDQKTMGKLAEELFELCEAAAKCGQAVARCGIQGIDEVHPVTGKSNREWLEDEIADVAANFGLVVARFNLDDDRMVKRSEAKIKQLVAWHRMA